MWSVLTSKPVALAAELASVVAAIALLVMYFLYRADEAKLAQKEHTIAQLQGSIEFQNNSINEFKGLADAAVKRAQSAQEASRRAQDANDRTITALLNRPLASPDKACEAADTLILEFVK